MTEPVPLFWNYDDSEIFESSLLPMTSFPGFSETATSTLDEALSTVIVISDPNEVNENFSIFIKGIIDNIYMLDDDEESGSEFENLEISSQKNYQTISKYALKLLTSNMFIKNYQFCIGKILTLLQAFTQLTEQKLKQEFVEDNDRVIYQGECLKEFLCITLLILLKLKNSKSSTASPNEQCSRLDMIDKPQLYQSLINFKFVAIMAKFIAAHIVTTNKKLTSFVLLKFSCDIFFEFLFYREVFDDSDFEDLINSKLISTIISYLLTAKSNHSYDVDGDTYEDEDKLVAYEQFKLLLLINEQFIMKAYTSNIPNRVMEVLMIDESGEKSNSRMVIFINLLIYHLNREESQIVKILILKFLNSVLTNKETSNLIYFNDLKILVDIFIRELNDLDYDKSHDTRILVIDYLRVMYPMLTNTQLAENFGYKKDQILEVLRNLVLSSENSNGNDNTKEQEDAIFKLASRCIGISWLKSRRLDSSSQSTPKVNETVADLSDISEIGSAFTRIASVRTSNRADYHRQTTMHNIHLRDSTGGAKSLQRENNHNLFLNDFESLKIQAKSLETKWDCFEEDTKETKMENDCNILDLPTEYLNSKPLPNLPVPERRRNHLYSTENSSTSSINSVSLLVRKALKKKAPPPPPPHLTRTEGIKNGVNMNKSNSGRQIGNTPPPPPPPRRRR